MKNDISASICSVDFGFQRIGGKYKGRIIWYIHAHKVLRYGELKRRVQGISTKMLTQTLKELEEDKLITRVEYAELPPRVEYSLTPIAVELIPFIGHLREWAERRLAEMPFAGSQIIC